MRCANYLQKAVTTETLAVITQNLFHQGNYCRTISLNAKYIVLLKSTRDKKPVYIPGKAGVSGGQRRAVRGVFGDDQINARLPSVMLRAGYRRPATVSNPHISRRGATRSLYTLVR